ncbi:membrane protein YfhO [Sarcina sp. DSM 11001]|nr:membrane protein YfhO [Sarcina sp. DSM 11001]
MIFKKEKRQKEVFLLLYTILFSVSAGVMLWYFSAAGKQMVWKGDGLSQHYLALCYYARWGKAVLGSLLSGRPAFPTFNMHMGFGSDLFTTLQYYVIGDPFSLPAVFVPQRYMLEFHDTMIVLRMYLAGLSFDGYCRTMGRRDLTGNLCGALVYVFSTFALFGMRHPYFLNAMIWFPLLLTGAERILRGSKGRLFTIAVFLSCISNFYFFYMLVLMTVVYVVWRACRIFLRYTKGVKVLLLLAGKFLARGVLGSAMGACFLLPILIRFVGDPRAAGETVYGKLYSLSYYTKLPEAFVAFGTDATLEYWTCLGFGGIGLVCVLLLILDADREKKLLDLRLAFAGMLLLTVLPSAGAALNGFSYPSNRWTWAFALLAGYITAVMIPSLARISWKKAVLLLVCINLYAVVCYLAHAHRSTYPEMALAAVAVLASVFLRAAIRGNGNGAVLTAAKPEADCAAAESEASPAAEGSPISSCPAAGCPSAASCPLAERTGQESPAQVCPAQGSAAQGNAEDGRLSDRLSGRLSDRSADSYRDSYRTPYRMTSVSPALSAVLLAAVIGTTALHAYVDFIPGRMNSSLEEYHSRQYIEAMQASDAAGMKTLIGNDRFYRYSGRNLANNFSLLHDVSNTQYYWSLSDGAIEQFFTETGQSNGMVHLYDNLDNRTMTDEIAGVRYQIRSDGSLLPFGYEKVEGLHYDNRELFEEKKDDPLPVFAFSIYENQYTLPLGFTCAKYLSRETYDSLTIPQRQEALMQGILLEEEGGKENTLSALKELKGDALSFTGRTLPNRARAEEGIEILQNDEAGVCFEVRDTEKAVFLENTEETGGCETGVLFTGMDYAALPDVSAEEQLRWTNTDPVEIKVTAKRDGHTVSTKKVAYTLPDNPWKTGRTDFLSSCGYSDQPLSKIRLKFSRPGIYSFRSLQVVCQPMEAYPAQAEALREYVMEETDLHELPGSGATDRITGKVTLPERRLLCLQIPRCRGMRAFVDGQETELFQADTMFSALLLEAGTHEIELRYRTPGLAAGAAVSVIAFVIFFAVLCRRSKGRGDPQKKSC